ncbi:hypothetical protein OC846_003164 [Tilletia horrida]|uniref:Uncharacterized protein n=1 Tax=Tilletia horrida TaxID=155126 RepID=A0AAN6GPK0_9BASI|nr:hypothetical protein OC846_003164 [Tilletia horrida]
MSDSYDPVEATRPKPPTSIATSTINEDGSSTLASSTQNDSDTFASHSSNANTSARTDELTDSTPAQRKGSTVFVADGEEGGVTQQVVKEGGEDVGVGEGGNVQID